MRDPISFYGAMWYCKNILINFILNDICLSIEWVILEIKSMFFNYNFKHIPSKSTYFLLMNSSYLFYIKCNFIFLLK